LNGGRAVLSVGARCRGHWPAGERGHSFSPVADLGRADVNRGSPASRGKPRGGARRDIRPLPSSVRPHPPRLVIKKHAFCHEQTRGASYYALLSGNSNNAPQEAESHEADKQLTDEGAGWTVTIHRRRDVKEGRRRVDINQRIGQHVQVVR